jgi:hypothetical protein
MFFRIGRATCSIADRGSFTASLFSAILIPTGYVRGVETSSRFWGDPAFDFVRVSGMAEQSFRVGQATSVDLLMASLRWRRMRMESARSVMLNVEKGSAWTKYP